jgi:phosphopantetheinyl transferase
MSLILAYSEKVFALENSLDVLEKQRAASFRFVHLSEQYTFAHAFKRRVLSHYFPHNKASEWRFDRTPSGKPFISENIAFNLSHSADSVAVAFVESRDKCAVGVDIERYKDMEDLESMIDMVCHPDERRQLDLCRHRQESFFQLWTAKEALLKANGSGLIDNLSQINCVPSLVNGTSYDLPWQGDQYCLKSFCFSWGVISIAWLETLRVSDIKLVDWTSGEPVTEVYRISESSSDCHASSNEW